MYSCHYLFDVFLFTTLDALWSIIMLLIEIPVPHTIRLTKFILMLSSVDFNDAADFLYFKRISMFITIYYPKPSSDTVFTDFS